MSGWLWCALGGLVTGATLIVLGPFLEGDAGDWAGLAGIFVGSLSAAAGARGLANKKSNP